MEQLDFIRQCVLTLQLKIEILLLEALYINAKSHLTKV